MRMSLNLESLTGYLRRQVDTIYPDMGDIEHLSEIVKVAPEKVDFCFSRIVLNGYADGAGSIFNHLNADQYTVFVYFCSNVAYKMGNIPLATKLFYLNKTLHGFHCMYDTQLPNVFMVAHTGGIVLGKAKYSDYFFVAQGCTVGANGHLEYPVLGEGIIMYPNSSLVGKSTVGSNCCISNGAFVNNAVVDDNSLVIGRSPELITKNNRDDRLSFFFKI